jgi:hypothetical protein
MKRRRVVDTEPAGPSCVFTYSGLDSRQESYFTPYGSCERACVRRREEQRAIVGAVLRPLDASCEEGKSGHQ